MQLTKLPELLISDHRKSLHMKTITSIVAAKDHIMKNTIIYFRFIVHMT
jgi:hypothetical protein